MISDADLEKRLRGIDLEIGTLNKLRRGNANKKKNKTFMIVSKRKLRKLEREQKELIGELHDKGYAIDKSSASIIHPSQLRQNMEQIYQKIVKVKLSHSDVEAFAKDFWEWGNVVKENGVCSDSVTIKLRETFNRYGTRFHIDVLSGRYHLVLNRTWAPIFLEHVQNNQTEITN